MPMFIYIAGKFSKPNPKKIRSFLFLYFVFQMVYTPFLQHFDDPTIMWSIITPQWILWYLITLTTYYLLSYILPLSLSDKQKKLGIIFTFAFAILVGFVPFVGEPFSLSRTIVFLPFFLIGKWENNSESNKLTKSKIIIYILLASVLTLIYLFGSGGNRELLFQRYDYMNANSTWYFRLLVMITAVLFIKILVKITPNKRIPIITNIGQNTLVIFLCHGFIVKLYHYYVPNFTLLEAMLVSIITIAIISTIHYLLKTSINTKRSNPYDMQNHTH